MIRPKDHLTPDEIAGILAACKSHCRTPLRHKAMVTVLWRCGLRVGEAISLDLADYRPRGRPPSLRILRPKGAEGGKEPREVGVDRQTREILRQWLEMRGIEPGPLFNAKNGARIDQREFRRALNRLAMRAGVVRRVHPHIFRHTFARNLYDEGVGIRDIQVALGHDNLNTTQIYLGSLGCSDAAAIMAERE